MGSEIKVGLSVIFVLFAYHITAYIHNFPTILSRSAMFVSLLTVLYFICVGSNRTAIVGLSALVVQFIFPLFIASSMLGYDSWFYVGTAQAFTDNGWHAVPEISLNASLFPGVQFFGIVFSEVNDFSITQMAHLYPLAIKAAVPVLVIGTYSRWTSVGAGLAALLLVSYSGFLIELPFHHLTHGIVLLLLAIGLLWRWIETSRHRDLLMLSVVLVALLFTHQTSTVYWGLLAAVAVVVAFLSRHTEAAILKNGFAILFTAGVAVFAYYFWLAPEYIIRVINFQYLFSTVTPQTPPIVQNQLVQLPRGAWLSTQGLGKEAEKNAAAVLFFLITASVGLFAICRRIVKDGLFAQPWIEFTAFASVGVLALVRLTAVVGLSHLGGTSRVLVAALPIGFVGMLATIHREASLPLRRGVTVIVVVILLVNIVVLPTYFFNSEPAELNEQRRYLTPQWQAGYQWLEHGKKAVVGTQGNIYLRSMTTTEPVSSYRPYAGDLSQTDAKLIHYRDEYRIELLIRNVPWSYRVPEQHVKEYNREWGKVYANGDSTVFYHSLVMERK